MVDPVVLACVVGGLETTLKEMSTVMRKTAATSIAKLSRDFSNCLFSGDGELVAQGDDTPVHMGAMRFAMEGVLDCFGKDVDPGDLIYINDSVTAGGHLPDRSLFRPVFYEDELVFWTSSKQHCLDSGGGQSGGRTTYAKDLYGEGIRIPPVKIYEKGKERRDVIDLIMANVRYSEIQRVDLKAQMAASAIGKQRLIELMCRYGKQTVKDSVQELSKRREQETRAWISSLPNGVYEGEGGIEYSQHGQRFVIPLTATVTVNGDELNVALHSPPQVPGYINSYKGNTSGAVLLAVLKSSKLSLPINEGTFKPIKIDYGPEGTICNAKLPASTGSNTTVAFASISDTVNDAMSKVIPAERLSAGWHHTYVTLYTAVDPRTNDEYHINLLGATSGGGGAVAGRDGFAGVGSEGAAGASLRVSTELLEYEHPLYVRIQEMRTDSGGAGKWRGGCGTIYEIQAIDHPSEVAGVADGELLPALSISGAKSTLKEVKLSRRYIYSREGEHRQLLNGSIDMMDIGERLEACASGGGGVGDPYERDPQLVLEDVINEVVSIEGARIDYGVAIDPEKLEVDCEETQKLRTRSR